MIIEGSGEQFKNRHCERSEAIQFFGCAGLPRRCAPRNDGKGSIRMIAFIIIAIIIVVVLGLLLKLVGIVIGVVIAVALVGFAMKKFGNKQIK